VIDNRIRAREKKVNLNRDIGEIREVSLFRSLAHRFLRMALAIMLDIVMIREARELNADLYICNDLDTLRVGVFMKLLGKIVVYDSHELYPDLYSDTKPYVRRLTQEIEALLIQHTDLVITVNEFISLEMSSRYGIPPPKVVMNCPRRAALPARRKKDHRRRIVLYHGGLVRERGLENVVQACKHLRQGILLVFRGEGPIENKLKQLAIGLDNCVFERPVPVSEVVSRATEADVGIVTYLPTTLNNMYASPNKLFEYLQAGLPIIGSNLPFIRKILIENQVGMVFDSRDPKDIARVVNQATEDDTLEKMKRNIDKIRNRFSWESESRKLIDEVSHLVQQTSSKHSS